MNLQYRSHKTRLNILSPYISAISASLLPISLLSLMAIAIWLFGPYAVFGSYAPLNQPEKRIYCILFLFLAWLLKFILIDLDIPHPSQYQGSEIRKKLFECQNRFYGAIQFLNKTRLSKRPCYLLIGPEDAGKTTLLANAGIHYILQKHIQSNDLHHPVTTENCDWWVTREASIIDVPGKYVSNENPVYATLWMFFLRLMKKHRGKGAIDGIIIALPSREMMEVMDNKLFQRVLDLQKLFSRPIHCQLVITKCDLLTGFTAFFAETSREESTQAFGVSLPVAKNGEAMLDAFSTRFNALIKKLNQQLLSRLHQERNPIARTAIKDFPLQVERIKTFTTDFIKKLSAISLDVSLNGVYLTSAFQPELETHSNIEHSSSLDVQLFEKAIPHSRAYFIKQFFMHGIHPSPITPPSHFHWKTISAYALSLTLVIASAILFRLYFPFGIKQTYQARNNTHATEQVATQTISLPEIKQYLEESLQNPVNRKADDVYATLKSYLMMGDATHFNGAYITSTLQHILTPSMSENVKISLHAPFKPMMLDAKKIQDTRQYLIALPASKLSYLILKNLDGNTVESDIAIAHSPSGIPVFANQHIASRIPLLFTAKLFNTVLTQQVATAIQETYTGNWILGNTVSPNNNANANPLLAEELRIQYITEYIATWENLLDTIRLSKPSDLAATDAMIVSMIGNPSPLLHLLKTIHDNTNFEAINVSSPRLQSINTLVDNTNDTQQTLYSIFASMQSLHQYLQSILLANDRKQAAFNAISSRMLSRGKPDAITQLRVIAETCPTPIRQWLVKITDTSWNYLMQEAGQYLDISWNEKVIPYYKNDIAGRYPFSTNTDQEVNLEKFTQFFGNTGTILAFYNTYLQPLVDTSSADWHWKLIDGKPLPFSVETLRQIQYAMRIHHSFFPRGDNKLYVQFALQPYKFSKQVKSVTININDKEIIDTTDSGQTHLFTLQDNHPGSMSSIRLTFDNAEVINRHFNGHWGWLKLLNQSFESVLTKKESLINLSMNEYPAKYILSSDHQVNSFMSLNLQLFHLPQQLMEKPC